MNDEAEVKQKGSDEALAGKKPEEQIQIILYFMESALAKEGMADFKGFWDARKQCLELFREPIAPPIRQELWSKFSELSKEARRLKEISDEQSSFAAEQIEIAIQAVELELAESREKTYAGEDLAFSEKCRALSENYSFYNSTQKELNFLNAYASRINSLRKELIKTDMRIRIKNQLFDRLSKAGDHLFPQRKELIQNLSETFEADVQKFVDRHFGPSGTNVPPFALKEEIKEMQNAAKLLTLNAKTFNQTRMKLSACWDSLKEIEQEKKKEFAEKKGIFVENFNRFLEQFEALDTELGKEEVKDGEVESKLSSILQEMRQKELGREEVKKLKERASKIRAVLDDRAALKEAKRREAEEERLAKRRALYQSFKSSAEELLQDAAGWEADEIRTREVEFTEKLAASGLNRSEQLEIEKSLKGLKTIARKKREEALLQLPPDALAALEQLREFLSQKESEKSEIKHSLEELRKKSKSSGLDFNRALEFNEKLAEEGERLQEVIRTIEEIEEKIEKLEEQIE